MHSSAPSLLVSRAALIGHSVVIPGSLLQSINSSASKVSKNDAKDNSTVASITSSSLIASVAAAMSIPLRYVEVVPPNFNYLLYLCLNNYSLQLRPTPTSSSQSGNGTSKSNSKSVGAFCCLDLVSSVLQCLEEFNNMYDREIELKINGIIPAGASAVSILF